MHTSKLAGGMSVITYYTLCVHHCFNDVLNCFVAMCLWGWCAWLADKKVTGFDALLIFPPQPL